jgi:hypothetical protein
MNRITPMHQFEIRYTNILDFPNVIGGAISPFVQLASKIDIESEYSHNQKVILSFESDYYTITVSWDRIIIRTNGDCSGLSDNNSIIDNPFFEIISKIKEIKAFGSIKNFLYYTYSVNILDIELEELQKSFANKYLTKIARELHPNLSDSSVILEQVKDNRQTHLTIGPYVGVSDLNKRGIPIINPNLFDIVEKTGEVAEFKYYEETKSVSFNDYKRITNVEQEYYNKIWKA